MFNKFKAANKGNGRGDGQVGLAAPNFFENHFKPMGQGSNLVKYFLEPGQGEYEPEKLLMRCRFRDEVQKNHTVKAIARYRFFNQHRHMRMICDWMAGTVSIGGWSRFEALQAGTGVVVPSLFDYLLGGDKKGKAKPVEVLRRQEGNGADAYVDEEGD